MKNIFLILITIFSSSFIGVNLPVGEFENSVSISIDSQFEVENITALDSCSCPQDTMKTGRLYALWGQSLMDGSADLSCLPANLSGQITDGTNSAFIWKSSGFQVLEQGVNNALDLTEWGLNIPLGNHYVQNRNEDVWFTQTAVNGAPLCSGNGNDWHMPNLELFDNFLNNIEDAREAMWAQGIVAEIVIISKQGEADAGDLTCSSEYNAALALHYDELLRTLGDMNIRVIEPLLHDNLPQPNYQYSTTVNTAKTTVCAALSNCSTLSTDTSLGYSYESDDIHWDCGGVLKFSDEVVALEGI